MWVEIEQRCNEGSIVPIQVEVTLWCTSPVPQCCISTVLFLHPAIIDISRETLVKLLTAFYLNVFDLLYLWSVSIFYLSWNRLYIIHIQCHNSFRCNYYSINVCIVGNNYHLWYHHLGNNWSWITMWAVPISHPLHGFICTIYFFIIPVSIIKFQFRTKNRTWFWIEIWLRIQI